MKLKQLFLLAVALLMLTVALSSCELPFDLPFDVPFLGGEQTTATEATTTTAANAPLPPITAAPNPITEVKSMRTGLRLTYKNTKTTVIEPSLAMTEGRNGVSYTHSFDAESGILTLTLFDSACVNIALSHLEKLPAPLTVRIRENNKNLEWTYEDSDEWSVLCKTADTKATPLATLCEATGFAATSAPTEKGVTLVIADNKLRFRAHNWQNEGYDFCNDAYLHSPISSNFALERLVEIESKLSDSSMSAGIHFKHADDEFPAININGTYIAALHGYNLISEVSNKGLTVNDIGRVFTRQGDGQQYVLVKVPNDKAWFCPFDEGAMECGDFSKYSRLVIGLLQNGDTLTYKDGDIDKTFTVAEKATQQQLHDATNHGVQHAYLNGTVEVDLTKNGVYNANFVDFYETYDAIYLPTVLRYLMDNVGKNDNESLCSEELDDSYLSYIQTYRFHNNGSFTLYQTVEFKADVKDVAYFGVMSQSFSYTSQMVYAPGAENCGTPTVHVPAEHEKETGSKFFYADGDYAVRSFYHFPDNTFQKGMNVGYYPYFGVATDEIRDGMVDLFGSTGQWSHLGKLYPHLYRAPSAAKGDSFSFIGYHSPITPIDKDFFAISWYFVGDDIYLSLNTDHAVAEKTVAFPNAEYLIGLSIEVDGDSKGITVHSAEVGADGIRVSSTGAGYITLKLTAK